MPLRSVIDLDVNDGKVDSLIDKLSKLSTMSKSLSTITVGGAGRTTTTQAREAEYLKQMSREWDKMKGSTLKVAQNVREIGSRLMHMVADAAKLTSMLGLVGGIATGFGFLGMDTIGRSIAGWRRSALGYGTTIGGQRAFGLAFGRFIDPGSFLGGVSAALHDPRKSVALRALGITPQPGADTATVAAQALQALQQRAKAAPDETQLDFLLTTTQAAGLNVTREDLLRLRRMSTQEFQQQQGLFGRDRSRFNLDDQQARSWQDFLTTLDEARLSIETTFVKLISPLAPSFAKLATSINKLLESFLTEDKFGKWMQEAADGIAHFADYLGSDKFQSDMQNFITGVENMAAAVGRALRFFGLIPGDKSIQPVGGATPPDAQMLPGEPQPHGGVASGGRPAVGGWGLDWSTLRLRWQRTDGTWTDTVPGIAGINTTDQPDVPPARFGHYQFAAGFDATKARVLEAHDYFRSQGWSEDQVAGIIANLKYESGGKLDPSVVNSIGAQGIGQWLSKDRRDFFRNFYHKDPKDATYEQQIAFVQWELTHNEQRAGEALSHAKSAAEAATIMMRLWERPSPGEQVQSGRTRIDIANQLRQQFAMNDRARTHVTITLRNETGGNPVMAAGLVG